MQLWPLVNFQSSGSIFIYHRAQSWVWKDNFLDEHRPTVVSVGMLPRMLLPQRGNQSSGLTACKSRMWFCNALSFRLKKKKSPLMWQMLCLIKWCMVFLPLGAQNSHTHLWGLQSYTRGSPDPGLWQHGKFVDHSCHIHSQLNDEKHQKSSAVSL